MNQLLFLLSFFFSVSVAIDGAHEPLQKWIREQVKDIDDDQSNFFAEEIINKMKKLRNHYQAQRLKKLIAMKSGNIVYNSTAELEKDEFEEDIRYTYEEMKEMEKDLEGEDSGNREKRQIQVDLKRWTDNTVYYEYHKDFSREKRQLMDLAMEFVSMNTCIDFYYSTTSRNRVIFSSEERGCSSYVGMNGGTQELNMDADGCNIYGTAVHEIMHLLGVYHTMTRNDRDNYVNVRNLGKDIDSYRTNIDIKTNRLVVPYEYGSAMHYPRRNDYMHMEPLDKQYGNTMGSRIPTFYDIAVINRYYECDKKCDTSSTHCLNGGYPHPRDCSTCLCPRGYGGKYCDKPANGGIVHYAKNHWIPISHKLKPSEYLWYLNVPSDETIWIEAPEDTTILIRIEKLNGFSCDDGCISNGLQVKFNGDPRYFDPLYCCQEDVGKVIKSKLNPTPLNFHSLKGGEEVVISYRFTIEPVNRNMKTNGYDNYEYRE